MHGRAKSALGAALLLAIAATSGGCGAGDPFLLDATARVTDPSACLDAPAPADAGTLVVLDWNGGFSTQTGAHDLAAFDVTVLRFTDNAGGSPDIAARFQAAVLARIQAILCDLDPLDIAVVAGDSAAHSGATIVHITGDAPLTGGAHIGQSDFDPCNDRPDDAAVIWGGALAARMPAMSFAQWVNVVANTAAHEIGHTLGFTHPSEETVGRLLPLPAAEIMRANVKPSELSGAQRFLIEQTTCPGHEPGDGSYALLVDDEIPAGG